VPNRVASRPVEQSQEPLRPAPVVGTSSRGRFWARLAAVAGPGLIVAFADTEAGSITTAASSGAQFGMKLVLLQIL
jgi:Mn2+/Fe2+ NRAMP family transporter